MANQIERTREYVQNVFAEMDSPDDSLQETVLVRDGHYCGHRFTGERFSAVWFFEEDEIKIYDQHRKLLRVESLSTPATPQMPSQMPLRRAA